jgi:hypothetical protein
MFVSGIPLGKNQEEQRYARFQKGFSALRLSRRTRAISGIATAVLMAGGWMTVH